MSDSLLAKMEGLMSLRRIVITILIAGAVVLTTLFFLRSNKESADTSALSAVNDEIENENIDSSSAKEISEDRSAASSVGETNSSSSSPSGGPARGARSSHPTRGQKSYNTQGAKVHEDPAFIGTTWKVWSGVAAYPKSEGEPTGTRLGEVNGYFLVDEGQTNSSENFDPTKPLVVLNPGSGTAGVVTGNFAVVLEEGASADFLSASSQLKIVGAFPGIQTYYVTSSQVPFNLKALQEDLREAPEVKEVKMEILDRQYEKF